MNAPPTTVTRRTALVLTAGTFVGAAACSPNDSQAPARRRARRDQAAAEPQVDADVLLAATVLADEQRVLDLVDATLERFPRLAGVLTAARDAHAAHVELLREAAPDEPLPTPSPAPSETATGDLGDGGLRVPRDRRRALVRLARHEDDLALVDKRSAFAAESGAFARVLASMAASAAQQSTVIRQVAESQA